MRGMKKVLLFILMFTLAVSFMSAGAVTDKTIKEYEDIVSTYSIDKSIPSYEQYKSAYPDVRPGEEIVIEAADAVRYSEDGIDALQVLTDYDGSAGESLLTGEEALAEWEFDVETEGWYDLEIEYYPYPGKNSEIQRAFFLDGRLPYNELSLVTFSRIWRNDQNPGVKRVTDENGIDVISWIKDNQGNDIKPSPQETPKWLTSFVYDSNGYISESLSFYLEKGRHTLGMLSLREPMLVRKLVFKNAQRISSYSETERALNNPTGICVRIEAETAQYTSSQMLYPVQDQASSSVYPASARYLLNNTIGGYPWRLAGQWIEWAFEVPEEGDYCITFFDKQNFVRGIDVYRRIFIDGAVPFSEFDALPFGYSQGWRMETAQDSNEDPYLIHLTQGAHTLRMEVVLGDMAEIISRVQQCVLDLNGIYRQVLYITGVSPDQYRDYQIERSLPGLKQELEHVKSELEIAIDALEKTAGHSSDKLTVLKTMNDQLEDLIEDQERFTKVLSSYKVNVRACGNWITKVLIQPLQIDRIYIHTPDINPKNDKGGFFAGLGHESQRLYNSFIIDYNQVGNIAADDGENKVITLWIGTGRDQANVIKSLIDDSFTPGRA